MLPLNMKPSLHACICISLKTSYTATVASSLADFALPHSLHIHDWPPVVHMWIIYLLHTIKFIEFPDEMGCHKAITKVEYLIFCLPTRHKSNTTCMIFLPKKDYVGLSTLLANQVNNLLTYNQKPKSWKETKHLS